MEMYATMPDVGRYEVYAGDDFSLQFTFKVDGIVQDVSAWTFTAQWRVRRQDDAAVSFTVDQTQSSGGIVILSLTPEQTRAMGMSGVFDLQGVDGDQVQTFLTGSTGWSSDVTRA